MYNVEQYLDQCVQSVRNQTLHDIEIILVDDGSPDKCGEMAENYAKQDPRIKVVHRPNGGLGPARNSGMEVAKGEYIGFVDSDDWIEPQMYEELVAAAYKASADVCFSGMQVMNDGIKGDRNVNPFAGHVLEGPEQIFELRRSFYGGLPDRRQWDPVPISVWTAVYRRNLLEGNGVRFRAIRSEDKFFNTAVCRAAQRVTAIGETRYNYRCDGQFSITRSFSSGMVPSYLKLFEELQALASEEPERFRAECVLRVKRCIVDYSRVASRVIANSNSPIADKKTALKELTNASIVQDALHEFPCRRLPIQQAAFAWFMRWRMINAMLAFASVKGR